MCQIGERLVPSIVFNGGASPYMIFVLASILRFTAHPCHAHIRQRARMWLPATPLPACNHALRLCRYLTPVGGSGGNVFVGKLDTSMEGDAAHAYVPNLAAQGAGYTFVDGSGVAQRLLGNFAAGNEEQKIAVTDALQARV